MNGLVESVSPSLSQKNVGKRSRGFTLIEVLVALFILAIGVLGAAAMQANSLKFNQAASARSQASFLAYDIVDRMRANRDVARVGGYDFVMGAPAPAGATTVDEDRAAWLAALASQLPEGEGSIDANPDGTLTVTIQWSEARIGGENEQTFVFVTEL